MQAPISETNLFKQSDEIVQKMIIYHKLGEELKPIVHNICPKIKPHNFIECSLTYICNQPALVEEKIETIKKILAKYPILVLQYLIGVSHPTHISYQNIDNQRVIEYSIGQKQFFKLLLAECIKHSDISYDYVIRTFNQARPYQGIKFAPLQYFLEQVNELYVSDWLRQQRRSKRIILRLFYTFSAILSSDNLNYILQTLRNRNVDISFINTMDKIDTSRYDINLYQQLKANRALKKLIKS